MPVMTRMPRKISRKFIFLRWISGSNIAVKKPVAEKQTRATGFFTAILEPLIHRKKINFEEVYFFAVDQRFQYCCEKTRCSCLFFRNGFFHSNIGTADPPQKNKLPRNFPGHPGHHRHLHYVPV